MSQADTVLKFPLNAPLAEIDGRLYMVGAYPLDFDLNSFTSDPVALTFGSLMRYDPFTNVWEALAPWPRPRYS
ncbi:MAG TPA: kelch repeat-containing protein, partial [Anaerolineae bacterium]